MIATLETDPILAERAQRLKELEEVPHAINGVEVRDDLEQMRKRIARGEGNIAAEAPFACWRW